LLLVLSDNCQGQNRSDQVVIYLRNGNVIYGSIIEKMDGNMMKIEAVDGNIYVLNAGEISRIKGEKIKSPALARPRIGRKAPPLAFILSFSVPGFGQFYNGEYSKGFVQLGAVAACFGIAATYKNHYNRSGTLPLAMALGVWAWSFIDAPISSHRINRKNGYAIISHPDHNLYVTPADLHIDKKFTPGLKLSLEI
jgi:hypothetical protein